MGDALDPTPQDREEERLRYALLRAVAELAGRATGRPVPATPLVPLLQASQLSFLRATGFLCVEGYLAYDPRGPSLLLTEKGARYLTAPGQRRRSVRDPD